MREIDVLCLSKLILTSVFFADIDNSQSYLRNFSLLLPFVLNEINLFRNHLSHSVRFFPSRLNMSSKKIGRQKTVVMVQGQRRKKKEHSDHHVT